MTGTENEITVLHVDDEPELLELSATVLEREDDRLDVRTVPDVASAVEYLESPDTSVDAIISDYDMPDRSGIAFLETVRETRPDLPFFLFTGKGSETVASEAISAGVTDYLQKAPGLDPYRLLATKLVNAVEGRRVEAMLDVERTKHAALFGHYPEPTVALEVVDGDPLVRGLNPAFESTFGYDADAAVGRSLNQLIVPEERRAEAQQIDDLARGGDPVDREVRRETVDGHRDFLLRSIPVEGPIDYYAVYEDITERKAHERELEQYAEHLTALYRSANRLYAADSVEECYRITIDAAVTILGFDWCTLAAPAPDEDRFEIKAVSAEAPLTVGDRPFGVEEGIAGQVYGAGEARVVSDAQSAEEARPVADTIRSALTVPVGDWGVFQAVTTSTDDRFDDRDRQHAELLVTTMLTAMDRIEHESDLEQQNERLDRFAQLVSHDLRNPLTVAMGRLALAREGRESEHLAAVANAHERMADIIDAFLTLAREGQRVETLEPVALPSAVERCWSTVETTDARVRVADDLVVRADPTRLEHLLGNLFRNAVVHAETPTTVTVGRLDGGFYVEDDGPGIPADEREQVLEPGYSTCDDGVGFGLSIVQEVAAAHDWSIAVAEAATGGVRFEVTDVELEST